METVPLQVRTGTPIQGRKPREPRKGAWERVDMHKIWREKIKMGWKWNGKRFVKIWTKEGYKPVLENMTGSYGDKAWGRGVPYPLFNGKPKGRRGGGRNVRNKEIPHNIGLHCQNIIEQRRKDQIDRVVSMIGKLTRFCMALQKVPNKEKTYKLVMSQTEIQWLFKAAPDRITSLNERIRHIIRCEIGSYISAR